MIRAATADEMQGLGEVLGRHAPTGAVLAAEGTLGAGKTTLAQGLARGLAVPDEHYVNSPTFAILQIHPGRVPFYHLDLYRIADPDEALGLGLEEVIGTDGVAFIEWPARLPEALPADVLWVRITPAGEGRAIEFAPTGPLADRWLAAACADARWPAARD
ncbi:MAG: tRNA (adenosine(37)-N6)-threonylcarbamoyltransferase complex ATPase subunit type 1 TsaE [Myxococcales bacterium]|nr:tRNA (adenosine(37)-N6)-threonylcarbamoyltransferase complex ATPase subunit type 1 TsaE [Myxococcales bacterium]